ncbi:hypothetical protein [Bradyrhizobium sp. CER78]|uniref:hypothetical protein n=1 Tax=Bradyrhizobium sp. CER78 TaxID=3039162 RepID=UPI0024472776|nr:hypothetical protein [Bradyrhizobium sp. CER78]MDH2386960.1 hypothetical protein [Bradyrhizobium sp. CER78]
MKTLQMQHELTAELERRSGVTGLKLIRLKGYSPSWDLGGTRETALGEAKEKQLRDTVTAMQDQFDIA